jgi:hypothetical protein
MHPEKDLLVESKRTRLAIACVHMQGPVKLPLKG